MKKLRILTLIEAHVLTSPAKIVLQFAKDCRDVVDLALVGFKRPSEDNPASTPDGSFHAAASAAGIPLEVIRESRRFDFAAVQQLKQLLAEYRPDLVQTHSVKSHFLVSLLRNDSFRWVAFHHGYTTQDAKMRAYNQLDRFSLRGCDRVVTVCRSFARDLANKGVSRHKIEIVPNSISSRSSKARGATAARAVRQRFGLTSGETVVVAVGRLSPEKGHKFLVEAVAESRRRASTPRFKVLIAGHGPERKKLARLIEKAGLAEVIQLIGHQSDVDALYGIADLFVMPSLSEGSPMALLESMAARVPIVATSAGGIPEMLRDDESARLVPPADAPALSAAIIQLLENRQLARQLADTASALVSRRFTIERYNRRILNICQSLLGNPEIQRNAA